ncbi:hypothetical protein DICPUDRAFT_149995 [Dictyostelium purpureum]|uniref:Pinin/SDK/MemA protein domain-containing protein n=1 Tax=Dictyostelium purpureum TaxID=5786 RepID=F0ZF67_DICPU|nr:uncharacterized protein DICPUDRAFT_149995 [Dictyostelium purpureum]EGC37421.1 hypothetical protein DICPUDRAFT_149995 [Dictyostelium purpureum]|eukprot:XP_003286074.1 hypothetical protein DICPUDRAFT_149995 [Dictyostelium purpureum]
MSYRHQINLINKLHTIEKEKAKVEDRLEKLNKEDNNNNNNNNNNNHHRGGHNYNNNYKRNRNQYHNHNNNNNYKNNDDDDSNRRKRHQNVKSVTVVEGENKDGDIHTKKITATITSSGSSITTENKNEPDNSNTDRKTTDSSTSTTTTTTTTNSAAKNPEQKRNRMFVGLLNRTLQDFQKNISKKTESDLRRIEVDQKIEKAINKEEEERKENERIKKEQLKEKEKKVHEELIKKQEELEEKILKESWSLQNKVLSNFKYKTKCKPQIYFSLSPLADKIGFKLKINQDEDEMKITDKNNNNNSNNNNNNNNRRNRSRNSDDEDDDEHSSERNNDNNKKENDEDEKFEKLEKQPSIVTETVPSNTDVEMNKDNEDTTCNIDKKEDSDSPK